VGVGMTLGAMIRHRLLGALLAVAVVALVGAVWQAVPALAR